MAVQEGTTVTQLYEARQPWLPCKPEGAGGGSGFDSGGFTV